MRSRDLAFSTLVIGTAVAAPLPYGSVGVQAITICLAALAAAQILAPRRAARWSQLRVIAAPLGLILLYCVVALAQSTPGLLTSADIWAASAVLLERAHTPTFSVDADRTRFAIGVALLLALALLGGLGLSQIRGGGDRLLNALAIAGLAYALLGLVTFSAAPAYVLFTPKSTHFGNLTGTFFNRNTEAAFLGAVLIVHLALIGGWLRRELPFRKSLIRDALRFRPDRVLLLRVLSTLPVLLALMMTGSRAGIIISAVAAALCIAFCAATLPLGGRRRTPRRVLRRAALAVVPLVVLLAIGGAGLDARIRDEGLTDEARALTYASSLELVADRPWAGHGVGTFELVFPAKRRVEASLLGVWTKAHSSLLELAVEVGVPFALAVLACFVAMATGLIRAVLLQPSSSILLVGALVLLQSGLHSLVDYPLQIPAFGIIVAVLTGAALGAAARTHGAAEVGTAVASQRDMVAKRRSSDRDPTPSAGGVGPAR